MVWFDSFYITFRRDVNSRGKNFKVLKRKLRKLIVCFLRFYSLILVALVVTYMHYWVNWNTNDHNLRYFIP